MKFDAHTAGVLLSTKNEALYSASWSFFKGQLIPESESLHTSGFSSGKGTGTSAKTPNARASIFETSSPAKRTYKLDFYMSTQKIQKIKLCINIFFLIII